MTTFNEKKSWAMINFWALHFWSLGLRRYSEEVLCLGFLDIGFLNGQNIYLFRGIFRALLGFVQYYKSLIWNSTQ